MTQIDGIVEAGWRECTDLGVWDSNLSRLGGHPLQSRLWGEARRLAEGTPYLCLSLHDEQGKLLGMARVEERKIPMLGKVAWIPKGPVLPQGLKFLPGLNRYLENQGYILSAGTPWLQTADKNVDVINTPRTIWIDLSVGKDTLLNNLDSQWRYGARRALREGVRIIQSTEAGDIDRFFELCTEISKAKSFDFPASRQLLQQLILLSNDGEDVEARLFLAYSSDTQVAGVFVLRCGKHLHYMWGAVDRNYAKLRAGEALHWAVIEWGLQTYCTLYDLEGIDPVNNQGTYQFKKKMGGREVRLCARLDTPLNWRGNLVTALLGAKR
jgi:hypothetical protein